MILGDFHTKKEAILVIAESALVKDFASMFNKGGSMGNKGAKNPYKGGSSGYKDAEILNKGGATGYKGTDIFNKGGALFYKEIIECKFKKPNH